jgi:pimeloyl-ACP methyl ester carboxylesterase
MKSRNAGILAAFTTTLLCGQQCENLMQLKLPHVEITSAAAAAAGPAQGFGGSTPLQLPARCVVKATSRPTSDSEIKIEVWMPATAAEWNGRYMQSGNGGWAGSIPAGAMANFLNRGYATAGTNDGHDASPAHPSGPAGWAIGHPEKLIDFGHRALHETAETAKAVIRAYYGKPATRNYFVGCSDGGREALMEAQRYPEDFHGIVAGAPANDWSYHFAGFIWNELAILSDPASAIQLDKLPVIQKAVLAQCDRNDGVQDGLLEDPRTCKFDPSVLACKDVGQTGCLTVPQIAALRKIYDGPKNPRTGKQIYPGYPPGHEAIPNAWANWIIAAQPDRTAQFMFGNSFYGQAVFEDPKWDFRSMNFDTDVSYAAQKAGIVVNSDNPDLRSFRANGGKLIQYHGWADAAISPFGSIEYYNKVSAFFAKYPDERSKGNNAQVSDFYRLFMVPGLGHCAGGIGPKSFGQDGNRFKGDPNRDVISALERWVETGVAPDQIIGTGTVVGDANKPLTRPLCSFPKVARYKGTGDPAEAANFTCEVPEK